MQELAGYALLQNFVRDLMGGAPLPAALADVAALDATQQVSATLALLREAGHAAGQWTEPQFMALMAEHRANYDALLRHAPQPVATPTRLYRATRSAGFPGLCRFTPPGASRAEVVALNEDHFSILQGRALRAIAEPMLASLGIGSLLWHGPDETGPAGPPTFQHATLP